MNDYSTQTLADAAAFAHFHGESYSPSIDEPTLADMLDADGFKSPALTGDLLAAFNAAAATAMSL